VYRGKLDPQSVSFRRFSIISSRSRPSFTSSRSSIFSSRPSIWSIPRLSILSRRASNDATVVTNRSQSSIDLGTVEVKPEDDVFISEPNSPDILQNQDSQHNISHLRSQKQGSQRLGSKRRGTHHRSFHRRVTFTGVPPIPEQNEDEKDIKDCVIITNTIEVEIINMAEPKNVDEGDPEFR